MNRCRSYMVILISTLVTPIVLFLAGLTIAVVFRPPDMSMQDAVSKVITVDSDTILPVLFFACIGAGVGILIVFLRRRKGGKKKRNYESRAPRRAVKRDR